MLHLTLKFQFMGSGRPRAKSLRIWKRSWMMGPFFKRGLQAMVLFGSPSPRIQIGNDALTELVNLGVGHATPNLRDMIDQQVFLSVPSVALIARQCAIDLLHVSEPRKLVAVHQMFEGDINGRALLIFPETRSLELVRAVTSSALPLEDIIELE
jgi:chemotaxis protein CheC